MNKAYIVYQGDMPWSVHPNKKTAEHYAENYRNQGHEVVVKTALVPQEITEDEKPLEINHKI